MLKVRLATRDDLNEIMEVERETFGELGEDAMASEEVMLGRIKLCNGCTPGWFWVVEHEDHVVGYDLLQPTNTSLEECTSWSVATDEGKMVRTFDPNGVNLYGVSLAVLESAPPGTADFLIHNSLVLWLKTGKRYHMICSRMPGFRKAHEETGVSPEDYWQLKRPDGKPNDWMLRLFREMIGIEPWRFLRDGFPVDGDSGGHGVLCVGNDPVKSLGASVHRVYEAGIALGKEMK